MQNKNEFNVAEDMVYASDIATRELLYMNDKAREFYGIEEGGYLGKKCYDVMRGKNSSCENCKVGFLNEYGYYTWLENDKVNGGDVLHLDKTVPFGDRLVRLSIGVNVTEPQQKDYALSTIINLYNLQVACLSDLHQRTGELTDSIKKILLSLTRALKVSRAGFCDLNDGVNSFYYSQNGEIDTTPLPSELIEEWRNDLYNGECKIASEIGHIKDFSQSAYDELCKRNVKTLLVFPLMANNNECLGILFVENIGARLIPFSLPFLSSLSYYVGVSIANRRNQLLLSKLSYTDTFTGLCNRNKFITDVYTLSDRGFLSLGIAYFDINRLKEINDEFGHAEGDKIIFALSKIMQKNFGEEHSYRLGGDEFVIVMSNVSKRKFVELIKQTEADFISANISVAVGYEFSNKYCNVEQLVDSADKKMYESKRSYYKLMQDGLSAKQRS